ncbi:MAG: DUF1499 domain-containing protein [Betaproteobacteria bacterium]|nr:DUF1499 domain-containing protein [Betaproteobacteria bacterium]
MTFSATPPADLGVRDGRLKPCPETPNCVSSQTQGKHYVAPLAFADAPDAALARLKSILSGLERVRIVAESAGYLRAEVSSRVFGFVDDLEFHVDAAARVVHVRSAARLGYSDFGVNRKRMERIRAQFTRAPLVP